MTPALSPRQFVPSVSVKVTALNGEEAKIDPLIQPRLDKALGDLKSGALSYNKFNEIHGEIVTVSQALAYRRSLGMVVSESTLQEFRVVNIIIRGAAKGCGRPMCPVCQQVVKGVIDLGTRPIPRLP